MTSHRLAERVAELLVRHSNFVIAPVLVATAVLLVPLFLMAPTQQASQDPGGRVFELQEKVDRRFPPRVHIASFIMEDRQGDLLRQKPLWELYQNQQRLRSSELGRFLFYGYDADNQRQIVGLFTIADAVDRHLRADPSGIVTLETATDDQVKEAVHHILANPGNRFLRDSLSKDASAQPRLVDGQEISYWRAAATTIVVSSDNEMLGGGAAIRNIGGDPVTLQKERFNRQMQDILRGEQIHYRLWGVAIDLNLESQEEGRTAVPFIAATITLVLLVVGATLWSWRAVGLAFLGLLMLLVWLKGGANLIGLKSSLTLDLMVPIAMISLGVDYFIHAAARYREEGRSIKAPAQALRAGFAGVLGALTLAMLTDGIAFFSNLTAGIETVIGFGVAAGIGVCSAYIILGMFLPLVFMRLERRKLERLAERASDTPLQKKSPLLPLFQRGIGGIRRSPASFAGLVIWLPRFPRIVVAATIAITVVTTYLAFQLEPKLDVKEFLDSGSDFVIGLDKLEEHAAPALAGEPAIIYIEGDLTAPQSMFAIRDLLDRLGKNPQVGHTEGGQVSLYSRTVLQLLARITTSEYARTQVLAATGVVITDHNGDGMPDTREQINAAYRYMSQRGVPLNDRTLVYDPAQVRETLFYDASDKEGQATSIVFGILGSREQAKVALARTSLERELEPLLRVPTITAAGLTGSPFTRDTALNATTRSLNTSLPVTVVACFALLAVWMRSVAFALVTVIPIGLVVSWLYAFMYLAGFHLNIVTATIAAVSIGVGIDYSVHVTQRYREELGRHSNSRAALRATAAGTGVALFGSAASSTVGFAVLGFTPMPLFSAYGTLTATMIFMAAAVALLVLPSLLMLVTPRRFRNCT